MQESQGRRAQTGQLFEKLAHPDRGGEPGEEPSEAVSMEEQLAEERRRAAWHGAAEGYQASAELLTSQVAARMIGLAEIAPRSELLDLGCGPGALSIVAQTLGALVTAYDIAPSMIALANERPGGRAVEFRIGDIRALQDRAEGFDTALANFSVLETGEPEAVLREAYRALKPGGRLCWSCWPAPTGGALFEMVDAAHLAAEGLGARPPASRGVDPQAALELTRRAGFERAELIELTLACPVEAATLLQSVERLDAANPASRTRSKVLAALEEALEGSAEFASKALLIVAEKPRVAIKGDEGEAIEPPRAPAVGEPVAVAGAPNAPVEAAPVSAPVSAPAEMALEQAERAEETADDAVEPTAAPMAAPEAAPRRQGGLVGLLRRWLGRR